MVATAPQGRQPAQGSPLTPRQLEVYTRIFECVRRQGFQPTVREIADHFGISSPNGVMAHLKALEVKGWTERSSRWRGLRLLRWPTGEPFEGFDKPPP